MVVDLTKPTIRLTKERATVNLSKKSTGFGQVSINLQWSQPQAAPSGGLLSSMFGKKTVPAGIDLDLGCLWEHTTGQKSCVQALGDSFGSFDGVPYIKLSQDDRSGASAEGEFLFLNGALWSSFKRVLIYAFIYEGVANWAQADGRVTVAVPGERKIEVLLDDADPKRTMCAVAMLENKNGAMQATRLARYFSGHEEIDRAYKWGLNWRPGTKD